jgi:hypothetical protein
VVELLPNAAPRPLLNFSIPVHTRTTGVIAYEHEGSSKLDAWKVCECVCMCVCMYVYVCVYVSIPVHTRATGVIAHERGQSQA